MVPSGDPVEFLFSFFRRISSRKRRDSIRVDRGARPFVLFEFEALSAQNGKVSNGKKKEKDKLEMECQRDGKQLQK